MALGGRGRMSGTGWHVEYARTRPGKKSDGKRKWKCIYYETDGANVCLKKMCDCLGVKGCKFYKEK